MASADQISCRNLGRRSSRRPLRVVAGSPPRLPGQRLAKRKARKEQLVKFDFCPMTSECSTAHNARRFQQSSARAPVGAAITEQDRLAPHPAARQGAFRARNCAAKSVFSFDGSTAVFFLPPQKENGGGKLPGFPGTPGRSTGQHGGVWSLRPTGYGGLRARHAGVVVPYGRSIGNGQRRANVPGPLPAAVLDTSHRAW